MDVSCDIAVIGSGGAGLAAAIVARDLGARVVVVEQSPQVGGTYALSSGLVWVPNSRQMSAAGLPDSREEALAHIGGLSGGRHDPAVLTAFLDWSPRVLDYLDGMAGVPFDLVPGYPDYYAEASGGKGQGRYLAPPVFPARDRLPEQWRQRLRQSPQYAPIPASWTEIQGWGGFGSIGTWDWDFLASRIATDARGFGSATIGFLLQAVLHRQIPVWTATTARALTRDGERVTGVRLAGGNHGGTLHATRGVILATGGYDGNDALKRRLDPHPYAVRLGVSTVDGSGLVMALEAGAALDVLDGQMLVPTIAIPGEEQEDGPLYRLFVREPAFPGSIMVNRAGQRFCNESFYRDAVRQMARFDALTQSYPNLPTYFVFDQTWKDRYPLGSVLPGEVPDWLIRGESPAHIAEQIGVSPAGLVETIARFNTPAARGDDPEFQRGSSRYSRNSGDPTVMPNPCVRPLQGPFYAVPVALGTAGSTGGLVTDAHGQVQHVRGGPMRGLYAAGNTAAGLVQGLWYTSGVANAKAITFAYLAAHHALGKQG